MLDKKVFTSNITKLRLAKNFTMQDLADLLGVNKATISRYESGDREPPLEKLVLLAETLEVSVDYLLGLSDNPKKN